MDPVVVAALRGSLALLFAAAAWHKLADRTGFVATLAEYQLLPRGAERLAAPALVTLEGATAIALVAPIAPACGPGLALILLALYTTAVAVNLWRGRRDLDCGCMGPAMRQPIGAAIVVRNGALAVAALICLMPVSARPLGPIDGFTIVAATSAAAALYAAAQRMMVTAPALRRLREEHGE